MVKHKNMEARGAGTMAGPLKVEEAERERYVLGKLTEIRVTGV